FQETVTGLAESFATTAQAASADLTRLAVTCSELADHVRGVGAESLRASEARFTSALDTARERLERESAQVAQTLAEVEAALDRGEESAAALVAEQEEGFTELGDTVVESDTNFSQADFDLQGVLHASTAYVGEALEQYMVTVFNAFYDHLQNEVPRYLTDLFQELVRTLHRALDEYDRITESIAGDMASENESESDHCVRGLRNGLEEREEDREASFDVMRLLLEETARCRSSADRGSEICAAYPPIVPLLAAAREVADRVQEMMDVFNPFGG
ncbi:MAG TPA: hypothetical protein VFO85_12485, partial [Vicinamibacteria bacterium]|nr:hypothetical protein [Vicinamibacteria bacterium]